MAEREKEQNWAGMTMRLSKRCTEGRRVRREEGEGRRGGGEGGKGRERELTGLVDEVDLDERGAEEDGEDRVGDPVPEGVEEEEA